MIWSLGHHQWLLKQEFRDGECRNQASCTKSEMREWSREGKGSTRKRCSERGGRRGQGILQNGEIQGYWHLGKRSKQQIGDAFYYGYDVSGHIHMIKGILKKEREGTVSRQNCISTLSGSIKQRKLNSCVIHSVSGVQGNSETMDMFNNFLWFLIPSSYSHS